MSYNIKIKNKLFEEINIKKKLYLISKVCFYYLNNKFFYLIFLSKSIYYNFLTYIEEFMLTGKVKWFNPQKGYGFISPDDGKKDIFVHISALEKSGINALNENDKVSYDEARNNGKVSAANIKVLND